jgi:phosphate transport system substrate-binding protein
VSKKAISRPEVKAFTEFYLKNVGKLSREVGYIELPQSKYDEDLAKIQ